MIEDKLEKESRNGERKGDIPRSRLVPFPPNDNGYTQDIRRTTLKGKT